MYIYTNWFITSTKITFCPRGQNRPGTQFKVKSDGLQRSMPECDFEPRPLCLIAAR